MMNPGVYDDLSNMAYHAETDWIGSTQLKRMIPEQYGPEPSNRKALWFGSAFHTTVLGGPSEPWSVHDFATWDSKAAREAAAAAEAAGEIPVLARDVDQINAMAESLKSHPEASNLIYGDGGRSEVSVFAEVDSVPSKARFDRIALRPDHPVEGWTVAVDVKTTAAKPSPDELARAVVSFGYDLSAVHYTAVAAAAGISIHEFVLIWVGKDAPHYVTVTPLSEGFFQRGDMLRDLALQRYLHPEFVDPYPGATGTLTLQLPRWAEL